MTPLCSAGQQGGNKSALSTARVTSYKAASYPVGSLCCIIVISFDNFTHFSTLHKHSPRPWGNQQTQSGVWLTLKSVKSNKMLKLSSLLFRNKIPKKKILDLILWWAEPSVSISGVRESSLLQTTGEATNLSTRMTVIKISRNFDSPVIWSSATDNFIMSSLHPCLLCGTLEQS